MNISLVYLCNVMFLDVAIRSCVAWQKEDDGQGFSLQYPAISCHAVSRDLSSFPHECLYLMIDGKLSGAVCQNTSASNMFLSITQY